jgi:hypothetical protein
MPKKAWTSKDERMYEHIKESEQEQEGRPARRAKQIAAATVNKHRKKEGRTKSQIKSAASAEGRSSPAASRATKSQRPRGAKGKRRARGSE